MGATEQFRMRTPGEGKVDASFRPDPAVEEALRNSVRQAEGNLHQYLVRKDQHMANEDLTPESKRRIASTLHDSTVQLLEQFEYAHLPEHLQVISRQFHDLAWSMATEKTERAAEQTTCLRKLREAKDCAVIMKVPRGKIGSNSPPLESDQLPLKEEPR